MSETNQQGELLILAAESIAGAVPGCSELLQPPKERLQILARRRVTAIDHFGPPILAAWTEWLGRRSPREQAQALHNLAAITAQQARQLVQGTLRRLHASGSDTDRQVVADFLAAIPMTARDVLASDLVPETGWPTRPDVDARSLVRFLPTNAPPFSAPAELSGTPYHLEELLGSGGFGAVYKATNRFEQNTPPRAIKFCLNPELLISLQRERELLDRLMSAAADTRWSDRVVKLYGHSLETDVPFLVYEYIPGGNLIHRLNALRQRTGMPLRPGQVLGLIRRICEPIAFAHGRGLVHRDIKPANILVTGNTIKLADFGIGGVVAEYAVRTSKIGLAESERLALSEQRSLFRGAGTPLYMSPEQRRGDPPDPRHDVYSIGVLWYQLLTGDCTRELHQGWADELADEFDAPQPQIELIQACVGYIRKRPASAAELMAALPAGSTSAAASLPAPRFGQSRILGSHDGAVNALAVSIDSRRLLSAGNDGAVRLWNLESASLLATFTPSARAVLGVAFSPDGRRAVFGCDTRTAWVWDLMRDADLACLSGHTRKVTCVAFSPDGRRIASAGDASIRIWHTGTGRELLRIDEHQKAVTGVCFSPDGQYLLSCGEDGLVGIWDSETGWEAKHLGCPGEWLLCLAVSPDGQRIACGGKDQLTLWDLESHQQLGRFVGHTLPVMSVAFSPNGKLLLSGSLDRTVRLWDVASLKLLHVFEGHTAGVQTVAITPDGRQAVSAGLDRSVCVWSLSGPAPGMPTGPGK